jgi:hypothetical protein
VGHHACLPQSVERAAGDARAVDRLANRFESFMEEFSNILHRQAVK